MPIFDLCLAWDWQYDEDFARLLEYTCQQQGISFLHATPHNLDCILRSLELNEISIRSLLDRATDSSPQFYGLVEWARSHPVYRINPYGHARRAWDKAEIHRHLADAGIPTPYTIVLPSLMEDDSLIPLEISALNDCFSIKPSHGGGGRGVHNGASTWDQVISARLEFPEDQYLLQETIIPCEAESRQFWFRVIYCGGSLYPCWWDTRTHIYTQIMPEEEQAYALQQLQEITETIHRISKLHLFSTEIACTEPGRFVVVDYVNDPIDLRLQSKAREGVPDTIVTSIAARIVSMVTETAALEVNISPAEIEYNH